MGCTNGMGRTGDSEALRVLVIGGSPEPASPETVRRAAFGCAAVIAVDRGLDAALAAGVPCDLFCGDGDSVGERAARAVAAAEECSLCGAGREFVAGIDGNGALGGQASAHTAPVISSAPFEDGIGDEADDDACEDCTSGIIEPSFFVERYNPHKDATDLELALDAVAERWPGAVVRATCLTGGAPDHFLAVMGRLARWHGGTDGTAGVELIEDAYEARILHAGEAWDIKQSRDQRFSFVALSPEAVVSEVGMRWNLDHKHVELLGDLGISNVIDELEATITCHDGTIAAFLFEGYFAGA